MVDFKPYDTTLAAAGTCRLWSPRWSWELYGLLGLPGEGSWGAERMGLLPPPQCGAWGTRSQESGRLLGRPLSGRAPSGPGRALAVGMQGWVRIVLTREHPGWREGGGGGVILRVRLQGLPLS